MQTCAYRSLSFSLSLGTSCVVTFFHPSASLRIFMKQLHHSASSRALRARDSLTLCYNFMYAKQLMMLYLEDLLRDRLDTRF